MPSSSERLTHRSRPPTAAFHANEYLDHRLPGPLSEVVRLRCLVLACRGTRVPGDAEAGVAAFSLAGGCRVFCAREPFVDAPSGGVLRAGNAGGFASSYAIAPSVIGTAGASFDLPGQASRYPTWLMGALASRGRARQAVRSSWLLLSGSACRRSS